MNFGSGDAILWDGPIRGTTAGDALFRFYNGFASRKQSGQDLGSRLDVLRRFVMAGERPATVPNRRLPRYRRRIDTDNLAVFPIDGGRRKASFILEKIKEDLADAGLPVPPASIQLEGLYSSQSLMLSLSRGGHGLEREATPSNHL
ncbi:uncharacterized protein LOC112340493 [Selaginella moellendorffii]|uniref:uncharacterized protein LOC112340493 n=1 Tax=Selaginella moellendorffii TaxID=88036 RepID=UPI000D1CE3CC|nr:uncharacterized protein LOC112340493 [Selaginella moellendorffii]|eukprot:XP_024534820.1 uncharacterized protein LOC112340493 [Selaginella moellendorffii]